MKKCRIFLMFIFILFLTGCETKKYDGVVNVLNWSSYIPDEVIKEFQDEYNIKVNYGTYSSNEELLAKITSSKKGTYDVIFPSDYMVELMISKKLIQKIDKNKISNYENIDPIFLNKEYDSSNDYSLPFLTTIVVIAVNRNNITDNIMGYNDLNNIKFDNNIVLLDDQRIVIGASLLSLDYDMNETDDFALKRAKNWLLRFKNRIKAYDSDSPKTFFMTDEVDIGVLWHAEAELAQFENNNIEIIYPEEGHAISTDNYTIVNGAKNVDNAYLFINYLLRDDVNDKITKEYPYISSNKNVKNTKVSSFKVFEKGYYVKNIGSDISKYDKLWVDIK